MESQLKGKNNEAARFQARHLRIILTPAITGTYLSRQLLSWQPDSFPLSPVRVLSPAE
jgi:hypothetical protein